MYLRGLSLGWGLRRLPNGLRESSLGRWQPRQLVALLLRLLSEKHSDQILLHHGKLLLLLLLGECLELGVVQEGSALLSDDLLLLGG